MSERNPVYVFDLDGVITDPQNTQVDDVAVGRIHELLQAGTYVAVNTGRSYQWVAENLLDRLERLGALATFDHLYIVCEKGGQSIIWRDNDFVTQSSRFALPNTVYQLVRKTFDDNKSQFATMFWDATKQTMATVEKEPSASIDKFKSEQQLLVAKLQSTLNDYNVKVDPTTIATDVESPQAGKHAGAELIYEWVAAHTDNAGRHFICFGDSRSDYDMAHYFAGQGVDCDFVFVGDPGVSFNQEARIKLIRPTAQYAAGTREYFENHT